MSEHTYEPEPICPHCGAVARDAWEINFGDDEGVTLECGSCEESMFVVQHISVTYSTYETQPWIDRRALQS